MRRFGALSSGLFALLLVTAGPSPTAAAPEGQLTWAVHVSLAPTWFDPAEAPGIITPLMEPAFLNGYGPRVEEAGLGLITNHAYSAPYEDLKLKKK